MAASIDEQHRLDGVARRHRQPNDRPAADGDPEDHCGLEGGPPVPPRPPASADELGGGNGDDGGGQNDGCAVPAPRRRQRHDVAGNDDGEQQPVGWPPARMGDEQMDERPPVGVQQG